MLSTENAKLSPSVTVCSNSFNLFAHSANEFPRNTNGASLFMVWWTYCAGGGVFLSASIVLMASSIFFFSSSSIGRSLSWQMLGKYLFF